MKELKIKNPAKLADIFGHILANAQREDGTEFGPLSATAYSAIRNVMYVLCDDNAEFDAEKFTASMHAVRDNVAAKFAAK
jgi:hypothetical protein